MRSRTFSGFLLFSNTNDSSSTYSMRNISDQFLDLKYFGLWPTIWPVEIGELLYMENMDFMSPLLVHSFSNVSANDMKIKRKRTGSMLSP